MVAVCRFDGVRTVMRAIIDEWSSVPTLYTTSREIIRRLLFVQIFCILLICLASKFLVASFDMQLCDDNCNYKLNVKKKKLQK